MEEWNGIVKQNEAYTQPADSKSTRIMAAAVLVNGRVWVGKRHDTLILESFKVTRKTVTKDQQGFWTNDGRFVSRNQALQIAVMNGQINPRFLINSSILTSEDLY